MLDPMAYPRAEIVDLYAHRWEIEQGETVFIRKPIYATKQLT